MRYGDWIRIHLNQSGQARVNTLIINRPFISQTQVSGRKKMFTCLSLLAEWLRAAGRGAAVITYSWCEVK